MVTELASPSAMPPGCKPLLLARQLLNSHGIGHESAHAKKIPLRIFQVPDQQLARFLAVFWMCDGYVDRSPGLTLASEQMVRQVQHLMLRFGIQSTVCPRHQGAHWRLRVPSPWWRRFLDAIPIWGAKRDRLEELVKRSRGGVSVIGLPDVYRAAPPVTAHCLGSRWIRHPGRTVFVHRAQRADGAGPRGRRRGQARLDQVPVRPAFQRGHEHDLLGCVPGILCSAWYNELRLDLVT